MPASPLLVLLSPEDLQAGIPTSIDILDVQGRLLLGRGAVIHSLEKLEKLRQAARKLASPADEPDDAGHSVFHRMEGIVGQLSQMEAGWSRGKGLHFLPQVQALAGRLVACCDADGDAALAQPHLDCHHGYSTLHHVLAAVVGLRLSRALGWDEARRHSLAAAALTHDIALLKHRKILEHEAPLSGEEHQLVRSHPEEGLAMLLQFGVRDHLWLRIVREHHETLCGDGYPRGLAGDQLSEEVRVMSLADAYSAMLRPRPFRGRKLASEAIDDLRLNSSKRYDPELVEMLVGELGIYPAGSVLSLANREVAVTIRNNPDNPHLPWIKAVRAGTGRPFIQPVARDPGQERFAIAGILPAEACFCLMKHVGDMWDDWQGPLGVPAPVAEPPLLA